MQNSMSGRKPQLTSQIAKDVTMPALDTTNFDQMELSEPHTTTCTVPHTFEPRFTAAARFDEDDFLTWSSRQKDAENILEYDE